LDLEGRGEGERLLPSPDELEPPRSFGFVLRVGDRSEMIGRKEGRTCLDGFEEGIVRMMEQWWKEEIDKISKKWNRSKWVCTLVISYFIFLQRNGPPCSTIATVVPDKMKPGVVGDNLIPLHPTTKGGDREVQVDFYVKIKLPLNSSGSRREDKEEEGSAGPIRTVDRFPRISNGNVYFLPSSLRNTNCITFTWRRKCLEEDLKLKTMDSTVGKRKETLPDSRIRNPSVPPRIPQFLHATPAD